MKFKILQDAVAHAVKNYKNYIVQTYFVSEEYMCEKEEEPYDVEKVLNCEYAFFVSNEEAERFRMTNVQSCIIGNHQVVINVQSYLDFQGQKEHINSKLNKTILLQKKKNKKLPF